MSCKEHFTPYMEQLCMKILSHVHTYLSAHENKEFLDIEIALKDRFFFLKKKN